MDWVDSSNKMLSANATFQELEERFGRLSTVNQTIIDSTKVLLFIKVADMKDQMELGLLLENVDGPITNWIAVKRDCGRFDKHYKWGNGPNSYPISPIERRIQDERNLAHTGPRQGNEVIERSIGGTTSDELRDMVQDLKIAQVRRDGGWNFPNHWPILPRKVLGVILWAINERIVWIFKTLFVARVGNTVPDPRLLKARRQVIVVSKRSLGRGSLTRGLRIRRVEQAWIHTASDNTTQSSSLHTALSG